MKTNPLMKKVLVRVSKRKDQTMIHIVAIYVTLLLATAYAVVCVLV